MRTGSSALVEPGRHRFGAGWRFQPPYYRGSPSLRAGRSSVSPGRPVAVKFAMRSALSSGPAILTLPSGPVAARGSPSVTPHADATHPAGAVARASGWSSSPNGLVSGAPPAHPRSRARELKERKSLRQLRKKKAGQGIATRKTQLADQTGRLSKLLHIQGPRMRRKIGQRRGV